MKRKIESIAAPDPYTLFLHSGFERYSASQELLPNERFLDQISRLLEVNKKGCTAALFIKGTIVIADNEIFSRSKNTNKRIEYIADVMSYFSKCADVNTDPIELQLIREEMFVKICLAKAKGGYAGTLGISDNGIISAAANAISEKQTIIDKTKNVLEFKLLDALITDTVADLIKVEGFIAGLALDDPIRTALTGKAITNGGTLYKRSICALKKGDKEKINPSYILLRIGSKNLHAEMRLVDLLLSTTSLTSLESSLYIGVSKLCCHNCAIVIKALQYVVKDVIKIGVRGQHGIAFEKWEEPSFMVKSFEKECHKDNIKFLKKIKNTYNKLIAEEYSGNEEQVGLYDRSPYPSPKKLKPAQNKVSKNQSAARGLIYEMDSEGLKSCSTQNAISDLEILGELLGIDHRTILSVDEQEIRLYKICISSELYYDLLMPLEKIFSGYNKEEINGIVQITACANNIRHTLSTEKLRDFLCDNTASKGNESFEEEKKMHEYLLAI